MDSSKPKENANPMVHAVRRKRQIVRAQPVGYEFLKPYLDPKNQLDTIEPQTTTERAVLMALSEIVSLNKTNSSSNDTLKVLQDAGFYLPSTPEELKFSCPIFIENKPSTKTCHLRDAFDADEVFDMIRTINDPEHPLTLEQLNVVNVDDIVVVDTLARVHDDSNNQNQHALSTVEILFTPTIPHCSMATLIGLCIRVKLIRSLPSRFKVTVAIKPGTHTSEDAINKQLADKERVAAALENKHLLGVVNKCIGRLDT